MLSIPDVPTENEWIALIQQDADQAQQHVISLRVRIKKQGMLVDPAVIISVEEYDRAQNTIAMAAHDPQQTEQFARRVALGRATLQPYPDREDWLALMKAYPSFAQDVCVALETKSALLGSTRPPALQASIDAYHSIIAHGQSSHDPA